MAWSDYTTRLKHKDLVPIPWMVAMALQMDGWYLRGDQIWAKGYSFHPTTTGSCMPESVTDRPTRGHEYLFLLSKGPKYYYDHEAVKEVASCPPHAPGNKTMRRIGARAATDPAREPTRIWGAGQYAQPYAGQATKPFEESGVQNASDVKRRIVDGVRKGRITGRNLRSVWLINPKPFKKAHFATFPSMLVEPCIKAGSRPGDLVLDPFAGSGTVALVADQLGRSSLSLEAQETYVAIAVDRLEKANIVPAVEFADG